MSDDTEQSIGGSDRGSKYFDVCTFGMQEPYLSEFESIRDAFDDTETALLIADDGTVVECIPQPPEEHDERRQTEDKITAWGITEIEEPSYTRVKVLSDAELTTVPLHTLAKLAIENLKCRFFGRSLRADTE